MVKMERSSLLRKLSVKCYYPFQCCQLFGSALTFRKVSDPNIVLFEIIGNTDAFCTKFLIILTILFSRDVQQRRFVIEQRRAMRGRAIRIQVTRMRLSQKRCVPEICGIFLKTEKTRNN